MSANGFREIIQRVADLSAGFRGPVLLIQGDTHNYLVDQPLVNGSALHGVTTKAPNLMRIVVEGETASEWLRLTVDPRTDEIFSWERVFLPWAKPSGGRCGRRPPLTLPVRSSPG